jgi:hypothetical protein
MLAAIFELIFSLLLEFVFEAVFEGLAEVGLDSFAKARRSKTVGPAVRGLTYVVVGGLLGLASYFIFPGHVFQNIFLRVGGMVLSAISMGLVLCLVSWFISRKDRNEPFWSTEKFLHGVIFGGSYSLTRALVVG